jgi:DNA-binding LacI/PurR family transcriptional regulator
MRVSKNTSRTRPSKTVAVFLSWFEPRILKGIARLAREKNWVLLLDYAQVHKWSAIPNKLDGLICLVGPERKPAEFLLKMNVPTVVLG